MSCPGNGVRPPRLCVRTFWRFRSPSTQKDDADVADKSIMTRPMIRRAALSGLIAGVLAVVLTQSAAALPGHCDSMHVGHTFFPRTEAKGISCSRAKTLVRNAFLGHGRWHQGTSNASSYLLVQGFKCRADTGLTDCVRGGKEAWGEYGEAS